MFYCGVRKLVRNKTIRCKPLIFLILSGNYILFFYGNRMNKYFLTLLFASFLLMYSSSLAQIDYDDLNKTTSTIEFGVLGGVDISTFYVEKNNTNEEVKMRSGFSGGMFFRYVFDDNFSIQPAAIFTMMGGEINTSAEKHIYKYNCLNIPIIVNMTFPMHDVIKPRLFMGPEFGIIMDADEEVSHGDGGRMQNNIKNKFNKPNFCMVFGAGVDYAVGRDNLIIDFRYNIGLNDINNGFSNNKVYSRNFSVMAGYSISL